MRGRLPGSRSPPAPNTTITRPVGQLPRRLEQLAQAVGGVGVVDDDQERLAVVDALEAAGRPTPAADRPAAIASTGTPSGVGGGGRGQGVGHVEAAGSGERRSAAPRQRNREPSADSWRSSASVERVADVGHGGGVAQEAAVRARRG